MKNYSLYFIKFLFFLIAIFIVSCGSPKKEVENSHENDIQGFWERKGTIQIVKGIPVDTIMYVDSEETRNYRQVKSYSKGGHVLWLNNFSDSINNPWKGGMGGYGKYTVHSNDSLSEHMSHGTGWFGAHLRNYKDSLKVSNQSWNFDTNLTKNSYSQIMLGNNDLDETTEGAETFAEYFEKFPEVGVKSKLDGVWKRVYEIQYVKGVAVDTTSVPSDVVLDVKVMFDGRYLYQVDQTKLFDPDKQEHGGFGGYGQFQYDGKGNLIEYHEYGSGMQYGEIQDPKTDPHYVSISFYNDNMFLQITKDTLGQGLAGRGLVYKKIN